MRTHTNDYKTAIKEFGREIDSKLTYNGNIIGTEQIYNITPTLHTELLKSVMKEITIESKVDIPVGSEINYQFGVKTRENDVLYYRDNYNYIDYGNYIVKESEYNEANENYTIKCYDKMLYSMKEYTTLQSAEFPLTIREYVSALCSDLDLDFANENDTFVNYNKVLQTDPYANINYTYRDIFDDLSEVTASNICINNDDELEIRYITETNDTIDEEYLKDINVKFGESFGAVNTIVLSRSADSDKIANSIPADLPDENKVAITIRDNQIMNDDNRGEYIDGILNQLYGLEFYLNDYTSTGICYYEACDRYTVSANGNSYSCVMFNDEVNITQGLVEQIDTPEPDKSENQYQYMTPTDKIERTTSLIVDKVNSRITAQAETIDIIATHIITDKDSPNKGDITAVTPINTEEKYFTFNSEGLTIQSNQNGYKRIANETGDYYFDGTTPTGEYTKDGSKQKDLSLFGVYKYGMDEYNDTPMFVAELYTDENGDEGFGHFYNRDI